LAGGTLEQAFRSAIRAEIESHLRPLQASLNELAALRALADQLSPLTALLGGGTHRNGRRSPRAAVALVAGRRGRRRRGGRAADRGCAIVGCKRPSRTKGYCAAHYQKLRMLVQTNRKPSAWVEFAPPNSVPDLVLPRGRAAHKARSGAREKDS
jgi:hypothetical protein